MTYQLYNADCLDAIKTLPADSIDALVTDPPAGISFMGKAWDTDKGGRKQWISWLTSVMEEAYRAMKPGAHGLVWALPRTSHWTATALEDAGFEIRDVINHIFGSGFPKSLDIGKAIDKAAGVEREVVGRQVAQGNARGKGAAGHYANGIASLTGDGYEVVKDGWDLTAPATPAAIQWDGWGTALKPAAEHWILIRKPLSEKTVAANVLKWGTGGINVDGCRVEHSEPIREMKAQARGDLVYGQAGRHEATTELKPAGRFPANVIHDGSQEVLAGFPQSKSTGGTKGGANGSVYGNGKGIPHPEYFNFADSGSAARFFYCAKASKADRDEGCEGLDEINAGIGDERPSGQSMQRLDGRDARIVRNHHPTVKSTALMRYLCKLITPPGGVILDCFMGSGSTGKAAALEGFDFIGIEQSAEYCEIAKRRIDAVTLPIFASVSQEVNA